MKRQWSFAQCLQQTLDEQGMSASEAARLVGFRSRNSIFRILSGATSSEVDARFLSALHAAVGCSWPDKQWRKLEDALSIKRVGYEQFRSNQAFLEAMQEQPEAEEYTAESRWNASGVQKRPLKELLQEIAADSELDVVISGCCDRPLMALVAEWLREAGDAGRAVIRHYIDIREENVAQNILSVLPLVSKVWYNARLIEEDACPPEMEALYRVNAISIGQRRADGECFWHQLFRIDRTSFQHFSSLGEKSPLTGMLDRWRFQLELLKPIEKPGDGPQAFVEYTAQYAELENDCMILSIKPDIHFNCVPQELLYQSIMEGFEQAGFANGPELEALLSQLRSIHEGRYRNMFSKRRPTHLVYSLPAMERFMQTGVQSDHFFIQRAYTPQERREILMGMYRAMQEDPYFNIHFLRAELPEMCNEMTYYEGKGVLLLDAYTGYDLHDDHSEALITLPSFQQSFHHYFMDELLPRYAMTRAESCAQIERLLSIG